MWLSTTLGVGTVDLWPWSGHHLSPSELLDDRSCVEGRAILLQKRVAGRLFRTERWPSKRLRGTATSMLYKHDLERTLAFVDLRVLVMSTSSQDESGCELTRSLLSLRLVYCYKLLTQFSESIVHLCTPILRA